jgi:hypothetical protein
MSMTKQDAESIAEKLNDFNPMLNVRVREDVNDVVATISKLEMQGSKLATLAEIVGDKTVKFYRSGEKVSIAIY